MQEILRVYSHPDCLVHQPGLGHPESPERLDRVLGILADQEFDLLAEVELPSREEIFGALAWVHSSEYLRRLEDASSTAPCTLDSPDCSLGIGSFQALLAAAGVSLRAALDLASGRFRRGFAAIRPPSHHAERDRAAGYCFLNATALAAEVLCRASGRAVLIADFDAHHGNGTEEIFYKRADVGYFSIHEYPAFPGSGGGDRRGEGPGLGTTLDIPLAPGADCESICRAFENGLEEMTGRMRPAAIIVSAGFSGHAADPLGRWSLGEEDFARIGRAIVQNAEKFSEGRVLSVLEGGYEPESLGRSVLAYLRGCSEEPVLDTDLN